MQRVTSICLFLKPHVIGPNKTIAAVTQINGVKLGGYTESTVIVNLEHPMLSDEPLYKQIVTSVFSTSRNQSVSAHS